MYPVTNAKIPLVAVPEIAVSCYTKFIYGNLLEDSNDCSSGNPHGSNIYTE
jgi:hypothetical protein